jgi:hypothetical protein
MGTVWARHGHGMLCVNRPYGSIFQVKLPLSLCLFKHHTIKNYGGVEVHFKTLLRTLLGGHFTSGKKFPNSHSIGEGLGPRTGMVGSGGHPVSC